MASSAAWKNNRSQADASISLICNDVYTRVSATDFQHRRVDLADVHEVKVMVVLERRA